MKKSVRRNICASLVALAVLLGAHPAHAEKTGNGGGAWVCRESNGAIRWSQLVDLFEAENEFGLNLSTFTGQVRDVVAQVQYRIHQADRKFADELAPYLQKLAHLEPNPPQVTHVEDVLKTIDDSLYRLEPAPRRCAGGALKFEQVANYKVSGQILVQADLFASLPIAHRAALVLHEAIYAYRRELAEDQNSVATRRLVGLIFSEIAITELTKELDAILGRRGGPVGMKFVPIPAGAYWVFFDRGEPRDVRIEREFEIQETELTQTQWMEVMGSNPASFKEFAHCSNNAQIINRTPVCPNHPVESVSWYDVHEFLTRLNAIQRDGFVYRLPTEVEWEIAARAGTRTTYSFGDDPLQLKYYGNYDGNSRSGPKDVATLQPNPYGLYDMHGNVMEWTQDTYRGPYGSIDLRGTRPPTRIARGGGYFSEGRELGSGRRAAALPETRSPEIGFRLVRERIRP